MQRVPLAEFDPKTKKRLEELWPSIPNLYRSLANHPALVAAWTEFANAIRHDSRTPRALRELMILRVAQLVRSEYEWAAHLPMARKAGVAEGQIQGLSSWKTSSAFNPKEKAALALAEAIAVNNVPDAVAAEVAKHFGHAEYVELSLTAAFYCMVSRMLDSMRVQLDDDLKDYSPKLP